MGDVQEHPAVGTTAALGDLGVVGQRDPVPGRQLHPLGVVAGHEPLSQGVLQVAALAAYGLGHQGARHLLGGDHPGRVELDQLHVLEPAAGPQGQVHAVAGVLVLPGRGPPPDPGVAARGQDRVGQEHRPLTGGESKGQRPEADPVADQQLGHVLVVDHGDAELGDLGGQRAQDRPAGPVAGMAGPPPPVGAEEPLVEAAVRGAGEGRPQSASSSTAARASLAMSSTTRGSARK